MSKYKTEQEDFWRGAFGTEYIGRNNSQEIIASNVGNFSKILKSCNSKINSVLEFGSNIGNNLKAINTLIPNVQCSAIEINKTAVDILKNDSFFKNNLTVYEGSILDFKCDKIFDLTLIKTVLIHINPEMLNNVYEKLYTYSNRYIVICEYYNPTPVMVEYRGNQNKLFKRDWGGNLWNYTQK